MFVSVLLVLVLAALYGPISVFATWTEQVNLTNPGSANNGYALGVELKGNYAMVSATDQDS